MFDCFVGSDASLVEVNPIVLTGDGELMVEIVQLREQDPACAANVLTSLSHTLGR